MKLFGESQLQIQSKSKHATITRGIPEILFKIQLTKQVFLSGRLLAGFNSDRQDNLTHTACIATQYMMS